MKNWNGSDHRHDSWIALRRDTVVVYINSEQYLMGKNVWACTKCGFGCDVYDLDNPVKVTEEKS